MKRGSGPAAVDSDPQTLPIPARPAAPSGLLGVNETVAGDNNGRSTGKKVKTPGQAAAGALLKNWPPASILYV